MRKINGWRPVAASLCILMGMTSCASDEYVAETSPDCALTAVTLGSLKRRVETQTTEGKDTVVNSTIGGSYYRMNIDQLNREVFNLDSLPRGTNVQKVVFSTMTADGSILYRDLTTGRDTTYVSTDSLDFTQPRQFTIVSTDGTARRTYTIRLNVRNADSQAFTWRLLSTDAALAATQVERAFVLGGCVTVLGRNAEGAAVCLRRGVADGDATFEIRRVAVLDAANLRTVCRVGETLYAGVGNALYTSGDGFQWTAVETDFVPARLLGNGSTELYAQGTDGQIYRSTDGRTWTMETTDTDTEMLPEGDVVSAYEPLLANPNLESVILTGFTDGDGRIWKKVVDHTGVAVYDWSYYPQTEENVAPLTAIDNYSLLTYDDRLLAWGMKDGATAELCSGDGGRTWLTDNVYTLPDALSTPQTMACTVEDNLYIWVVCGGTGEVWRGYLNRLHVNVGEN